jgi:hypothetical protein
MPKNRTIHYIILSLRLGKDIHDVAHEAINIATDTGVPVRFKFNDKRFEVDSESTVFNIVNEYHETK